MGNCGCCSYVLDRPLGLSFTTLQSDAINLDEVENQKVVPKESDCLPLHTKIVFERQGNSQDLLTEKELLKVKSSHTTVASLNYTSGSSENRTKPNISGEERIDMAFDEHPVNKVKVNPSEVGFWIHQSLPIHSKEQADIWLARGWSSSIQNPFSKRETEASSFRYLNARSLSTQLLQILPSSSLGKSSSEPVPVHKSARSIAKVVEVPHFLEDMIEEFEMDNLPHMLSNEAPTKKENGGQLCSLHNLITQFKYPTSESNVDLQSLDSGSWLFDSAEKVKINEEITPADTYRSLVAHDIESACCPNGGDCYGVMPWDICWLRDDDENSQ